MSRRAQFIIIVCAFLALLPVIAQKGPSPKVERRASPKPRNPRRRLQNLTGNASSGRTAPAVTTHRKVFRHRSLEPSSVTCVSAPR